MGGEGNSTAAGGMRILIQDSSRVARGRIDWRARLAGMPHSVLFIVDSRSPLPVLAPVAVAQELQLATGTPGI